ncbi:hypothetical protein AB0L49_36280 [Streptomyces antimycoticus]|uniref:hypothetical protein n=1 Tax=Streptomyces antimycoticus TaxID=68175 RepID=UPI0033C0BB64
MGYTTTFTGKATIDPPLNPQEISYLRAFTSTRRMDRTRGPYVIDGSGSFGQGYDKDITNYNGPPDGQPEVWCNWVPTDDGTALIWNGAEKFYSAASWMAYLIDTFLKPDASLAAELHAPVEGRTYPPQFEGFTFDHQVNGEITAQGEEPDDRWVIRVRGNAVVAVDL